jgi:hypothetical protein
VALPKIAREVGSGIAAVTKILLSPQQIPSPPFKVFTASNSEVEWPCCRRLAGNW